MIVIGVSHPSADLDDMTFRRGDVIAIFESGAQYGPNDLAMIAAGHWHVIQVPDASIADLIYLTKEDTVEIPVGSGLETTINVLAKRTHTLDLDLILTATLPDISGPPTPTEISSIDLLAAKTVRSRQLVIGQ